ncbi:MAG TPA: hypothetical protein VFS21_19350 [Roseiflexaceae bacterium]|nr:hypothetical protein [Roseiflexaceae bacterium]
MTYDIFAVDILFTDADPHRPHPVQRAEAMQATLEALRTAGYDARPAYTGAMGGDVLEVVRQLANSVQTNKEMLIALVGLATPVVTILGEQLKRRAEARQQSLPQIVVIVETAQVTLPATPISDAELLQCLLASDPALPQRVTPQTRPMMRIELPAVEERKRR